MLNSKNYNLNSRSQVQSRKKRFFNEYHNLTQRERLQFIFHFLKNLYGVQQYIIYNLLGQVRYYVYADKRRYHNRKWPILKMTFTKNNLMHLCGVRYFKNKLALHNFFIYKDKDTPSYTGAKYFWTDLYNVNLNFRGMYVNNKDFKQKLQVISYLAHLDSPDYKITNGRPKLRYKYPHSIRTKRQIMELALTYSDNVYHPESLLNVQNSKSHEEIFDILAILPRKKDSKKVHLVSKSNNVDNTFIKSITARIESYVN